MHEEIFVSKRVIDAQGSWNARLPRTDVGNHRTGSSPKGEEAELRFVLLASSEPSSNAEPAIIARRVLRRVLVALWSSELREQSHSGDSGYGRLKSHPELAASEEKNKQTAW